MIDLKTLILILLFVYSCNTSKNSIVTNCNKNEVQKIADDLMNKKGYNLTSLNCTIDATPNYYLVNYFLKDTMSLGGGAEIKISKKDCRVIEQKYYQ